MLIVAIWCVSHQYRLCSISSYVVIRHQNLNTLIEHTQYPAPSREPDVANIQQCVCY